MGKMNTYTPPARGIFPYNMNLGDSVFIGPADSLQTKYDWLKSADRDTEMGVLSSISQRQLILTPGIYVGTLELDTDYVNVRELITGTVQCKSSVIVQTGIKAVCDVGGQYYRDGNDYAVIDNVGSTLAANTTVVDTFPLTSRVTLTATTIDSLTDLTMQCENSLYIFAAKGDGDVYRLAKTPAASWEKVATGKVTKVWPLEGAKLFGVINDPASESFFYSADNGTTWTACETPPSLSAGATLLPIWSCSHKTSAEGGPVTMLCEYGGTIDAETAGLNIHISTDYGVTWETSMTAATDEMTTSANTHFHTINYHAGTDKWLAIMGDGANKRWFWSDDDGDSWTTTMLYADGNALQPVILIDDGHATEFLCASDTDHMAYRVDVNTFATTPVITTTDTRASGECFMFAMCYTDGIYYAFQLDDRAGSPTNRKAKIYASDDGENWAVIYQFTANEKGVKFVSGLDGDGYIHVTVVNSVGTYVTYKFNVPTLAARQLVKINPATANFLDENESISNTNVAGWRVHPTQFVATSEVSGGLFDTKVAKLTKGSDDVMAPAHSIGNVSFVRDGRGISCRMWIRGHTKQGAATGWQCKSSTGVGAYFARMFISSDKWLEIILPPVFTSPTGATDTWLFAHATFGSGGIYSATEPVLYVGSTIFNHDRSGLQVGGNNRSASRMSKIQTIGSFRTDGFAIIPDVRDTTMTQYPAWVSTVTYGSGVFVKNTAGTITYESKQAANTDHAVTDTDWWGEITSWKWHVKTYWQDASNYMVLYLDAQDGKFKLDVVVADVVEETIAETNARTFEWMGQINFAVRVDNTYGSEKVSLTVDYAGVIEHVDGSDAEVATAIQQDNWMGNKAISEIFGDMTIFSSLNLASASRGDMTTVPMWVYAPSAWTKNVVLSDADVATMLSGI